MSSDESSVAEPPTRRSRPNEDFVSASSSAAASAAPSAIPTEPCTASNFFGHPGLTDRQRLQWALRTEAEKRFAKLQSRESAVLDDSNAKVEGTGATIPNEARDDTLNSEYLIDLYPPPASASALSIPEHISEKAKAAAKILKRDRENFKRKLMPALSARRQPDASFDSLAKLDIDRPTDKRASVVDGVEAAPPNLLYFDLLLEGYMGYSVPNYHDPDPSIPRGAVMGGAVLAALTSWGCNKPRAMIAGFVEQEAVMKNIVNEISIQWV